MSIPVVEHIAVFITDAVNAITTDNGFNQVIKAIRPKRLSLADEITDDLTAIIQMDDPSPAENQPNETAAWVQPFAIQVILIAPDNVTTSYETRINKVRSDIEKKLTADLTCGGYAYNVEVKAPNIFGDESFTGVVVNIEVEYRTVWNDPYTKA